MPDDPMQITRVYATPDGVSHVEDIDVPLAEAGAIGWLSRPELDGNGNDLRRGLPATSWNSTGEITVEPESAFLLTPTK